MVKRPVTLQLDVRLGSRPGVQHDAQPGMRPEEQPDARLGTRLEVRHDVRLGLPHVWLLEVSRPVHHVVE